MLPSLIQDAIDESIQALQKNGKFVGRRDEDLKTLKESCKETVRKKIDDLIEATKRFYEPPYSKEKQEALDDANRTIKDWEVEFGQIDTVFRNHGDDIFNQIEYARGKA